MRTAAYLIRLLCHVFCTKWNRSHVEKTTHRHFVWNLSHWSTKLNLFFVPRTSVDEFSSTFYAEFRNVYRIFLSGRVSKTRRNLNVQTSTLRAHETGRNFPLKCRVVWLSPVFGVRYIRLQCPTIVCRHTSVPRALVLLFNSHNVLVKSLTYSSLTSPRFSGKKSKCDPRKWIFILILHPIAVYEVNRYCPTSWGFAALWLPKKSLHILLRGRFKWKP
jgi:hypothetical protein